TTPATASIDDIRLIRRKPHAFPAGQNTFIYGAGVVLPLVVYALFVGYPIIYNIYLSLTSWNGLSPKVPFVGLANYVRLLHDPSFWNAFVNTVLWSVISLIINIVVPMVLAIILASGRIFTPTLFRSLLFLPVTMSLVAIGLMYSLILSPGFGAFDQVLRAVGLGAYV